MEMPQDRPETTAAGHDIEALREAKRRFELAALTHGHAGNPLDPGPGRSWCTICLANLKAQANIIAKDRGIAYDENDDAVATSLLAEALESGVMLRHQVGMAITKLGASLIPACWMHAMGVEFRQGLQGASLDDVARVEATKGGSRVPSVGGSRG